MSLCHKQEMYQQHTHPFNHSFTTYKVSCDRECLPGSVPLITYSFQHSKDQFVSVNVLSPGSRLLVNTPLPVQCGGTSTQCWSNWAQSGQLSLINHLCNTLTFNLLVQNVTKVLTSIHGLSVQWCLFAIFCCC